MEIEEADEIYNSELDKAEKIFLDNLKINNPNSEKILKKSIEYSRNKYQANINKILERKKGERKKIVNIGQENYEHFKSETGNYNLSIYRRIEYFLDSYLFKLNIKIKRIIRLFIPEKIIYLNFKFKLSFKRIKNTILDKINNILNYIGSIISNIKSKFSNLFESFLPKKN